MKKPKIELMARIEFDGSAILVKKLLPNVFEVSMEGGGNMPDGEEATFAPSLDVALKLATEIVLYVQE